MPRSAAGSNNHDNEDNKQTQSMVPSQCLTMEVNAQHCHRLLENLYHPNICRLCETWAPWIGHSLVACTLALLRIDFVRRNPIVEIGRGPNNDVMFPSMRCETLSFPLIFCTFIFHFACLRSMRARVLGMYYVLIISRSNGMDARRIAGPMSSCTTARPTALGYVPFAPALHASPTRVKNAHTHTRTHGRSPRTQINGVCVAGGESCILRDEKRSHSARRCSSKSRSKTTSSSTDLAPKELTGVHAHDDMAHELGRSTFATVMKAMARITGCWWAVKIIHTQKLHPSNNNKAADATAIAALLPP
jgi:hypothetical protein